MDLGEFRTQIITEINRDDLADELATAMDNCIARSIDYFAAQRFSFNEKRGTGVTVIGDQYVDLPTDLRLLDELYLIVGNVRYTLTKRDMAYIEELYSTPQVGQPTDFAVFDGQIRLWPTPPVAYSLVWLYVKDVVPALDYTDTASTNDWLVKGVDVIDARTRYLLYRDTLRDSDGAMIAMGAQSEALARLKSESNRLIGTGRVRASW